MTGIRRIVAQRHFAGLFCAVALLLRLLVPTGYMVASDHGRLTVILCPGSAPHATAMAMPGMHDGATGHGRSRDHGKAEMPCAFSGLSAAALAAIDPSGIVAPVAFARAPRPAATLLPVPPEPDRLRPPLRGPPDLG